MSAGEGLSQDVVFDVLSSKRRRQVLLLLKNEGPMRLTELAEMVAAMENDTSVDDLTKQQRKRVYVSLYQTHVPKLEDAGLVSYEQDSGVVELQARASGIEQYLDGDSGFRWQYVYVTAATVGLVFVVASVTDFWLFGGVSESIIAVLVAGALATTALVHLALWAGLKRRLRRWVR